MAAGIITARVDPMMPQSLGNYRLSTGILVASNAYGSPDVYDPAFFELSQVYRLFLSPESNVEGDGQVTIVGCPRFPNLNTPWVTSVGTGQPPQGQIFWLAVPVPSVADIGSDRMALNNIDAGTDLSSSFFSFMAIGI